MKKILLSLIIIGAVGAVVAGVTTAYFSDTETAVGNTITAGTIDIQVNGDNHWTKALSIGDLKPGETDYMNLGIENVGMNPVNISKKLFDIIGTGGASVFCSVSSEPEFVAENGKFWSNGSCNKTDWTAKDDIETQIYYDLSVKVYNSKGDPTPIWWQTIETGDKKIKEVYSGSTYVDLGMLPVEGYMFVEQSYHFDEDAGNVYQGDVLTFNMEIKGEQLAEDAEGNATVTLENKTAAPEYAVIDDTLQGVLTYKTKNSTFDFSFTGTVKQLSTNYTLLYAVDPWPQTGSKVLGTTQSDGSGKVDFSGTVTTGSIANGKVWLVLSSDWNSTNMTAWHQADYLLETGLVNYTQN